MEFPAYVPDAVRGHISAILEGDSWEAHGFIASLKNAEQELSRIEREIETRFPNGRLPWAHDLREQKAEALTHRDRLVGDVECLRRLGHDERMREVFSLLNNEFTNDQQWRGFIYAAWAARVDFAKYRDSLKRAAGLKEDIANSAEKLAKLIRQLSETGINGPGELYSIPELLRQTDNHEMRGHNLHMWRSMRQHVLGDLPRRDVPESEQPGEQSAAQEIVRVVFATREQADIDPVENARSTLRYAWGTAPYLSELLDTVANAARRFEPSESGMIGAAIQTRQQNKRTEYLRAFGNLLTDVHGLALTPPIMRAIAIVANVVINLPDIDVTYGDVRQALKN